MCAAPSEHEPPRVGGRADTRRLVDGAVALAYAPDSGLTGELARLVAAEHACCSFPTFALVVGPDGTRLTVTAPDDARALVTELFDPSAA